jgi:hypothetical protein
MLKPLVLGLLVSKDDLAEALQPLQGQVANLAAQGASLAGQVSDLAANNINDINTIKNTIAAILARLEAIERWQSDIAAL